MIAWAAIVDEPDAIPIQASGMRRQLVAHADRRDNPARRSPGDAAEGSVALHVANSGPK